MKAISKYGYKDREQKLSWCVIMHPVNEVKAQVLVYTNYPELDFDKTFISEDREKVSAYFQRVVTEFQDEFSQ